MAYTQAGLKAYAEAYKEPKKEAGQAPLGILDGVDSVIKKCRGTPAEIKAGIQALVLGSVAAGAALSLVPFTDNFGSHFAGGVLRDLMGPGVSTAINAPARDYLENIFPTGELNVRLLVTGIEKGALTDEEVIETGVDMGLKDREIRKLLKIAKMARFEKETREDYAMLDRYQDALISAAITSGRAEIDAAVAERQALIKEYQRLEREQAMEEAAP